jgi:hypothetical protein
MRTSVLLTGLLITAASCSASSNNNSTPPPEPSPSTTTGPSAPAPEPVAPTSPAPANTSGPTTSPVEPSPTTPTGTTSPQPSTSSSGPTEQPSGSGDQASTDAASTEPSTSPSGDASSTAADSAGESSDIVGLPVSNCTGTKLPDADPTKAGPFQVASDKNVGPLAGVVPDPIYGQNRQRFNVYRPSNLAQSGHCHPILIWANGYRDNPEQNPPDCVVDQGANRWCGQYQPLLNHLASHGFVVVASLSTATAEGDPLPTIAGLDWIIEQSADPSSPYYQRLDTTNIGQLGHSYGGMSTCMSASEPRYKALATICGTRALSGVHTPMLFYCGGNDSTVSCESVKNTFSSVTDQPAFFMNERTADHGSWVYTGAGGVSLSSSAAWFRAHLMDDAASRQYFYGANCKFCSDNRVEVEQNALMRQ